MRVALAGFEKVFYIIYVFFNRKYAILKKSAADREVQTFHKIKKSFLFHMLTKQFASLHFT